MNRTRMISSKLVEIALEYVGSSDFERFCQVFYAGLVGIEFVPLGGMHDGGADAFQGEKMFGGKTGRSGTFYQASTQEDYRAKIRRTIARLREFGRNPTSLQYITSRTIGVIDKEEEHLSAELDIAVKIRDRKWIAVNINHSPQTMDAFEEFLRPSIAFLAEAGAATLVPVSAHVQARTLCVFLGQEIDRRRGKSDLLEAVTDSLILWALEGTDPEKGIFLPRQSILEKIEAALPSAKHFIRGVFTHRLETLASKGNPTGREVRWHKKGDKFCLPYETRKIVEAENTEDEFLKLQVLDIYRQRAITLLKGLENPSPDQIVNVAQRALELTFEKEGLELAEFLSGERDENYYGAISDQVDEAIREFQLSHNLAIIARDAALSLLRQAFYNSTEEERIYYGKLSRTYTLLFTLRNEPKIVEYFKGMSSNFILIVGADIIVRALSERYLRPEDRMTTNMLRILHAAGSTLILTQMVVEEVHGNLAASDYEFRNWFMEVEPYVDKELVRHCEKILVRSYFYAKIDPLLDEHPAGWKSFIEQVCNYNDLHNAARARDQVRDYLIEKFGFEYLDEDEIGTLTDEDEVQALAEKIKMIRRDKSGIKPEMKELLAYNDARHILAVYGKRSILRESHRPNPYGYRTWWLTHETKVRQCTGELVKMRGSQYIIRPEFILNFVALSPTMEEVRSSYRTIFPTLLGVRLSNRMREEVFHDVMRKVKEARNVDEARVKVMVADMSNRLKGDNFKQYEAAFGGGRAGEGRI